MRVDSEALLDLLPDVVVVMEADSTIVYVNAAVTTILGWAPEDLVGRTGFELVHPDEREEAILRIAAQVEEPEVMRRHHVEIARRDGGFTKFEMLAAVEPGDTGRFLLVLRDISERDEAQKRLHRSDEQLRALTENVPDALGRFDRAGHLEFSTRSFDELVAAESGLLERWAAHAAEVVASGERVDIDHELGGGRWIEVRFVPERTPDGATSHVLVIATDVTARREHEQRLVTAAGHDPLTGLPNRRRLHELAERLALPGPERRRALGAGEGRGVLAAASSTSTGSSTEPTMRCTGSSSRERGHDPPTTWCSSARVSDASESMTRSAAEKSPGAVMRFGTATHAIPAALAAVTPWGESSTATARVASTPSESSAAR